MGAEQSTRRDPPPFLGNPFEVVLSQNCGVSAQSCQRSSRPSVSEFSNSPEKYPNFVLVLVLSTGKMEVMTRLEARSRAAKVKIVATSNESGSSDNASFFRQSSDDDTTYTLYFDPMTGRLGSCKKEDKHRYTRHGLVWLGSASGSFGED